jgi:hypothetical protein
LVAGVHRPRLLVLRIPGQDEVEAPARVGEAALALVDQRLAHERVAVGGRQLERAPELPLRLREVALAQRQVP